MRTGRLFLLPGLLAIAACGGSAAPEEADNVDPAVKAALADPIMTDPQLEARSDTDALRPADRPVQALVPPGEPDPLRADAPPTVVARAGGIIGRHDPKSFAGCNRAVGYGFGWASRLPDTLPLPGGAQVSEAAGSDATGCGLRLVAFSADMPPSAIADSYRRAATSGGFAMTETTEGKAMVVKAGRTSDGAAFLVTIADAGGGASAVDLVSNRGR